MIELRTLTGDDWPVWRELRLAALADAPHAYSSRLADWQGAGDREERWRARLDLAGSRCIVALLDGQPVGMVGGGRTEEPGVVTLVSLWVSPAARGRRIGELLIGSVEQWARDGGAPAVRLDVAEDNDIAIALYERNGYRRTGGPGNLLPDGVRREFSMEKRLSAPSG